ncbi:MAG: MoxR family ATPase [bacterium]
MTRIPLPTEPLLKQPLRARPRAGLLPSVHLLDHASIHALNAALVGGRPLLLRGQPGVGKSQLARAAADLLGRALVMHTVTGRTETDDLLWQVDLVARLAEAQLARTAEDRARVDLQSFVCPGPLWWAFDWTSAERRWQAYRKVVAGTADAEPPDDPSPNGVVVLIDEIDKADPAVPNGLLDALGHRGFTPPGGLPRVCQSTAHPPLVIFTTNEERHLPDAFLRRCFVHTMKLPDKHETLVKALCARGEAHGAVEAWGLSPKVLESAAEIIAKDRRRKDATKDYLPGVAEYLDLLRALRGAPDPAGLLKTLATFVLDKQADA